MLAEFEGASIEAAVDPPTDDTMWTDADAAAQPTG